MVLKLCEYIFYRRFRNPRPINEIMEEHLQRFSTAICSGLCKPLATKSIIEVRRDVLRRVIRKKLALNTKIWLDESDFQPTYFPRGWSTAFVTKRGDRRSVLFPIAVRLFLARSRKLYSAEGKELPRKWIEKLSISLVKRSHWRRPWNKFKEK